MPQILYNKNTGEKYLNKVKKAKTQMDEIIMTQQQIKDKNMIDTTIRNMNDIAANIDTQFNSLSGTDKTGILSKYQAFQVDIKNLIEGLNKMKSTSSTVLQADTYEGLVDPDEKEANINKLLDYYNNSGNNFIGQYPQAFKELFNDDELAKLKKNQGRPSKKRIIKNLLQSKYNVLEERFGAKAKDPLPVIHTTKPDKPFKIPEPKMPISQGGLPMSSDKSFNKIIKDYINDPKATYGSDEQDAIMKLFDREEALKIQGLKTEKAKKDFIKKDFSKKQDVMERFSF